MNPRRTHLRACYDDGQLRTTMSATFGVSVSSVTVPSVTQASRDGLPSVVDASAQSLTPSDPGAW